MSELEVFLQNMNKIVVDLYALSKKVLSKRPHVAVTRCGLKVTNVLINFGDYVILLHVHIRDNLTTTMMMMMMENLMIMRMNLQ